MTPAETALALDAATWRAEHEQRRAAWLAWHMAALSRARHLPALRRLLTPPRAKRLRGAELARRRREHEEIVRKLGGGR